MTIKQNIIRDVAIAQARDAGRTNEDIALEFGLSRERIVQIYRDAKRRRARVDPVTAAMNAAYGFDIEQQEALHAMFQAFYKTLQENQDNA